MAAANPRRRQRPAVVRVQLLDLVTYNFEALSAIHGSDPAIAAGGAVADNTPNLRTLLLKGWAVASA